MALTPMLLSRVTNELNMLVTSPPPGVSCWPVGDSMTDFEAVIIGADSTPYEKGEFKLTLTLPLRYPMEPPRCLFKTKIWHPNIDEGGRICLDILNLPPKGSWKPSLNMSTVLTSLRLLLSNPNPEDPLVGHISDQYVADYESFARNARAYTHQYASPSNMAATAPSTAVSATPSAPQSPSTPSILHSLESASEQSNWVSPSPIDKKRKNEDLPSEPLTSTNPESETNKTLPDTKRPKLKESEDTESPTQTKTDTSNGFSVGSAFPASTTASNPKVPLSLSSTSKPVSSKAGISLGFSKKPSLS